jgi:hypothetical protein
MLGMLDVQVVPLIQTGKLSLREAMGIILSIFVLRMVQGIRQRIKHLVLIDMIMTSRQFQQLYHGEAGGIQISIQWFYL